MKPVQYPDLDRALSEWFYRVQDDPNLTVTGEVLREKARWFFNNLPQYHGQKQPLFSDGWLSRFKARHAIRRVKRYGEAASVDEASMAVDLVSLKG